MQHGRALYYFAGGGTGGHLFPGLTLAAALRARDPDAQCVFVGSERPLERELIARQGFEHRMLPVEPLPTLRRNPLKFAWRNWRALGAASSWLKQLRPAAVVGLGGFASVPTVLAAGRLHIPTLLLEQNVLPGRATKWLGRRADLVCLSFPESVTYFSCSVTMRLTGNPVRAEIAALSREPVEVAPAAPPTLLILGGSQGATRLNDAVVELISRHRERFSGWKLVHQTGAQHAAEIDGRYRALALDARVEPFFIDMPAVYRAATMVISRAGATTLAEVACAGLPAVLVPYPQAADNHQLLNAEAYARAGAAATVPQCDNAGITAERLAAAVLPLLEPESAGRREMAAAMRTLARPDAAAEVLRALDDVASPNGASQ